MRRLDQIIVGGIGLLVVLTPLCLGSVHPWSYALMEAIVFALLAAWMVRAWLGGGRLTRAGGRRAAGTVALPIALVLALMGLEMVPMPPALLATLSPTAYEIYARALPGWPTQASYRNVNFDAPPARPSGLVVLPTAEQVRAGAKVPFAPAAAKARRPRNGARQGAAAAVPNSLRWRTLSFEPGVARAGMLKALAYAALFLLVALYPFGAEGDSHAEERFCRTIFGVVLAMGFMVAFLGLMNWASWNGKILWFFVPQDWQGPHLAFALRATGPFVNPDHFANYLAMVLPLALVAALLRIDLVPRAWAGTLRMASMAIAFVMLCAIVLSLSRGGWISTALSVGVLVAMFFAQPERRRAAFARHTDTRTLRWVALAATGLFIFALMLIGPQGRNLTDVRLAETVSTGLSLSERGMLYRRTLAMIRDFPLFGVGMGAWGELFTRYVSPPWSQFFYYREAHNDYLQFAAESGLIALLALGWLFWRLLRRIGAAMRAGDPRKWPLLAAVVAAVVATALHELIDFNLHVPANAALLAVLLGLALRLATPAPAADEDEPGWRPVPRVLLAAVTAGALALVFTTFGQKDVSYPNFIPAAKTLRAAGARVIAHPADSDSHYLMYALGAGAMSQQVRMRELSTAVWLDPTDPDKRDVYASMLARHGQLPQALVEVTRSVFNSPTPSTHFYLSPELVRWLAPVTQAAVEKGFRQAVAAGFPGAFRGIGQFYSSLNLPLKEAALYAGAAAQTRDPTERMRFLIDAGKAYAAAGYMLNAEGFFRTAMEQVPGDPAPYLGLVRSVYGPDRDMRSAKTAIEEAAKAGEAANADDDPYDLDLALAAAAGEAHDPDAQESALKDAVAERPQGSEALLALGEFYLDQAHYDRAALILQQAIDTDPSGHAWFDLGRAQEGAYNYYEAEKAYAQAVAVDPKNRSFNDYYVDFKHRMAKEQAAQARRLAAPPTAAPSPGADD
ncbi:MAG TPA: O-antigen ligase family protein [Candidatus Binataceae bacterium]|nr:O-antigen ligase family protein [Candidatus Binataceae bacterium]